MLFSNQLNMIILHFWWWKLFLFYPILFHTILDNDFCYLNAVVRHAAQHCDSMSSWKISLSPNETLAVLIKNVFCEFNKAFKRGNVSISRGWTVRCIFCWAMSTSCLLTETDRLPPAGFDGNINTDCLHKDIMIPSNCSPALPVFWLWSKNRH